MRVTQILIGNLEPPIKKARYWNDGEEEEESVGNNDDCGGRGAVPPRSSPRPKLNIPSQDLLPLHFSNCGMFPTVSAAGIHFRSPQNGG